MERVTNEYGEDVFDLGCRPVQVSHGNLRIRTVLKMHYFKCLTIGKEPRRYIFIYVVVVSIIASHTKHSK